jgi:hypothetical protein
MAASDAIPVPRKNTAFRMGIDVRNITTYGLITSWTGADSQVSKDGAAYAVCTNEATEIGSSGTGYIEFTASEMNADMVQYRLTLTNTNAETLVITLYPEEAGDYRANTVQVGGTSQTARDLGANLDATVSSRSTYAGGDTSGVTTLLTRLSSVRAGYLDNLSAGAVAQASNLATLAGYVDTEVAAIQADVTTLLTRLSSIRAGYLDNLSAGAVAQASNLATLAGYVDTEVAAILAIANKARHGPRARRGGLSVHRQRARAGSLRRWRCGGLDGRRADGNPDDSGNPWHGNYPHRSQRRSAEGDRRSSRHRSRGDPGRCDHAAHAPLVGPGRLPRQPLGRCGRPGEQPGHAGRLRRHRSRGDPGDRPTSSTRPSSSTGRSIGSPSTRSSWLRPAVAAAVW